MRNLLTMFCLIVLTFGVWLGSVPLSGGRISYDDRLDWGFYIRQHQMVGCAPGRAGVTFLLPGHSIQLGFLDIETRY